MKALLLVFALVAGVAHAQLTQVNVKVDVTPAGMAAGATSGTVQDAITAINANYATNNIPIQLNAYTTPTSGTQVPSDSNPNALFNWMNGSLQAANDRNGYNATMGIVVGDLGLTGTTPNAGLIPAVPPTTAHDSTALVNARDLQFQLERAISRILGQSDTNGYTVRARVYPYQGENVCFHTKYAPPSSVSTYAAYLNYWSMGNDPGTSGNASASPSQTCALWIGQQGNPRYNHYAVSTSGSSFICTIYDSSNSIQIQTAGAYHTVTGSSPIDCGSRGDEALDKYACSGPTCVYRGFVLGDPNNNAVKAMSDGTRLAAETVAYTYQNASAVAGAKDTAPLWTRIMGR